MSFIYSRHDGKRQDEEEGEDHEADHDHEEMTQDEVMQQDQQEVEGQQEEEEQEEVVEGQQEEGMQEEEEQEEMEQQEPATVPLDHPPQPQVQTFYYTKSSTEFQKGTINATQSHHILLLSANIDMTQHILYPRT